MLTPTKTFLNLLFVGAAGSGFAIIFFETALAARQELVLLVALVGAYALLVTRLLRGCVDRGLAEHHLDSIYFLGFLLTLVSLLTLFVQVQEISVSTPAALSEALHYVGISVTTSLAGILGRNIGKGNYLKHHPEQEDSLEKTYALLQQTAERFAGEYRKTFEKLDTFLSERAEVTETILKREQEYGQALGRFTDATSQFSSRLAENQAELSGRLADLRSGVDEYARHLGRFNEITEQLSATGEGMRRRAEELPLDQTSAELERFHGGVKELNQVLDSLIGLLDEKVEKVG